MKKPQIRKRVLCAAAAVLLTGLSSTVFVSAEPRALESRAASAVRTVNLDPQQDRTRPLSRQDRRLQ